MEAEHGLHRERSKNPSSTITRPPPSFSSAGWKMKCTLPANARVAARWRAAPEQHGRRARRVRRRACGRARGAVRHVASPRWAARPCRRAGRWRPGSGRPSSVPTTPVPAEARVDGEAEAASSAPRGRRCDAPRTRAPGGVDLAPPGDHPSECRSTSELDRGGITAICPLDAVAERKYKLTQLMSLCVCFRTAPR